MTVNSKASAASAIKDLREKSGIEDISGFARSLEAARSLVSQLESGTRQPSSEMCLRLGKFAAERKFYPEALWFYEKAGMTPEIIRAARRALEGSSPVGEEKFVKRPLMEIRAGRMMETGLLVPLPSTLAAGSTVCLALGKDRNRFGFAAGEILVLGTSADDKQIHAVRDRAVLLDFVGPSSPEPEPSDKYRSGARRWEQEVAGPFLGEIRVHPGRKLMMGVGDWEVEFGPLSNDTGPLSPPEVIGFGVGVIADAELEAAESAEDFKQIEKQASETGRADMRLGDRVRLIGKVLAILPRDIAVPAEGGSQSEPRKKRKAK